MKNPFTHRGFSETLALIIQKDTTREVRKKRLRPWRARAYKTELISRGALEEETAARILRETGTRAI